MDTQQPSQSQGAARPNAVGVEELLRYRLEIMKAHMPLTMECIEDRVLHAGPEVRSLVRRALRGEPGCFYAIEGGHVMGNPAGMDARTLKELGEFVVVFGCAHVCIWPADVWNASAAAAGSNDGAN